MTTLDDAEPVGIANIVSSGWGIKARLLQAGHELRCGLSGSTLLGENVFHGHL